MPVLRSKSKTKSPAPHRDDEGRNVEEPVRRSPRPSSTRALSSKPSGSRGSPADPPMKRRSSPTQDSKDHPSPELSNPMAAFGYVPGAFSDDSVAEETSNDLHPAPLEGPSDVESGAPIPDVKGDTLSTSSHVEPISAPDMKDTPVSDTLPDPPVDPSLLVSDVEQSIPCEELPTNSVKRSTATTVPLDETPDTRDEDSGASSDEHDDEANTSSGDPDPVPNPEETRFPLDRVALLDIERHLQTLLSTNHHSFVREAGMLSVLGLSSHYQIKSVNSSVLAIKAPQNLVDAFKPLGARLASFFEVASSSTWISRNTLTGHSLVDIWRFGVEGQRYGRLYISYMSK